MFRLRGIIFIMLSLSLLLGLLNMPAAAAQSDPVAPHEALPTDRVIVRLRDQAALSNRPPSTPRQATERLRTTTGIALEFVRTTGNGDLVLQLDQPRPHADVVALADQLSRDPAVLLATPDSRLSPMIEPDDPGYLDFGWPLQALGPASYGINLPDAWTITTGDPNVVVAVLDSGAIIGHADLAGRTPPNNPGYDLLSDALQAGDGSGRDPDPSDEGDFVTSAESLSERFAGCSVTNSLWHGTHVAGIVGARANNDQGLAGVTWDALLLHVRVLGKCGGYISDIADGIRWAVGETVSGTTLNLNPAQILNLSLGGTASSCNVFLQDAINSAVSRGAVIVVSAGNFNADASGTQPANCNGVIPVASTTRAGQRAFYSNYGNLISLAAPGGSRNVDGGIYSTLNAGTQRPANDSYAFYQGTSMAAPHVTGVAAMMRSVNPGLSPAEVRNILELTATPFPPESSCIDYCGAGILNAGAAVEEAARRVRTVSFQSPASRMRSNDPVSLPLRLSLAAATPLSVPFRVTLADQPNQPAITGTVEFSAGSQQANLQFTLPALPLVDQADLLLTVQLTATGRTNLGTLGSHSLTVSAPPQPELVYIPNNLDFGAQQASKISPSQTITLTNQGDGLLQLTDLSLSGPFSRTAGTCPTNLPANLAPASSCTLEIAFAPKRAIQLTGSLTISSTTSASPQTIALRGVGITPALGFGPTNLSFAPQLVGVSGPTLPVTITNPGTAPLLIEALSASEPFTQTGGTCPTSFPASLAPASSCTTLVAFQPTVGGQFTGELRVTGDLPGTSYAIPLRGLALAPELRLSRATLDFGSQLIDTSSATRSLTLSNQGDAPLSLDALELAHPAFALTGGTCPITMPTTLDPGASCQLEFSFTPTSTMVFTDRLRLSSDDPTGPHTVDLSGQGSAVAAPSAALEPPQLRFVGPTDTPQMVKLSNLGSAPLAVTDLTLDNPAFAVDTSACGLLPFQLAPAATCALSVQVTASTPGTYEASLALISDDSVVRTVALQATIIGEGPPPPTISLSDLSVEITDDEVFVNLSIARTAGSGPISMTYQLIAERVRPDANLIIATGLISMEADETEQTIRFAVPRLALYGVTALNASLDPLNPIIPPRRALLPPERFDLFLPLVIR